MDKDTIVYLHDVGYRVKDLIENFSKVKKYEWCNFLEWEKKEQESFVYNISISISHKDKKYIISNNDYSLYSYIEKDTSCNFYTMSIKEAADSIKFEILENEDIYKLIDNLNKL